MKLIHSFDVFDTCLTRRTAAPTTVFYEVARKVFLTLGIPSSRPLVEDFVAARIEAERLARVQTSSEDITLDEIWRNLCRLMGWQYNESMPLLELEAEQETLLPIASTSKAVQEARKKGHRIVFVSDMYLPADFIQQQLIKHGVACEDDGFYVSNKIGKSKATGNLFRHLLSQENSPASNVWHTGDNRYSDYDMPRKLGIHARLFSEIKLTRAEIDLIRSTQDFAASSLVAGAMRSSRLRPQAGQNRDINKLSSQFVGPLVTGFATWVLQRARENGIKRLYFVARDCQLTCKVAQELSPQFGGIECRYFYASRQALCLPSANAISPEEMPWMDRFTEVPALNRLLAKLELIYDDVESSFKALAGDERGRYQLKSALDWEFFWKALNEEPIKNRVVKTIITRREAAHSYYENEGMFDSVPWALVDLGWSLSCQQFLWKLLRLAKWNGKMTGFYLQLFQRRASRADAGNSEALFYSRAPDYPDYFLAPLNNVALLEHVIGCADHPTVHHYEKTKDGFGPAFTKTVDENTLEFCRDLHASVLEFVRHNRSLVETFADPKICREALHSLAKSFVEFPSKGTASSLLKLSAATDQNNLDVLPIVKALNLGTALLPLISRRKIFDRLWRHRNSIWPEGSLAITSPNVRRLNQVTEYISSLRTKLKERLLTRV